MEYAVNIHSGSSAYSDVARTKAGLDYFGFTWVRDNSPAGPALLGPKYHVQVVLDTLDVTVAVARVNQAIAGNAALIECVNEPKDPAAARKVNLAIVTAVANRVPVVGSALNLPNPARAAAVGVIPGVTFGSIHPYRADMSDADWNRRIDGLIADSLVMNPGAPIEVTETGLWNGARLNPAGQPYSHHPTDPALGCAQIVANLDAFAARDVLRVFYYELFDQPGLPVPENSFGLLRADGTPKPHAVVLRDYIAADRYKQAYLALKSAVTAAATLPF